MDFGQPSIVTATGSVRTTPTRLIGFYVNSTTSGTLVLHNAAAATNAVTGTITPAVGWHPLPISFGTALHAVVGGTLNATFVYQPK
jgi:hypothetical protein